MEAQEPNGRVKVRFDESVTDRGASVSSKGPSDDGGSLSNSNSCGERPAASSMSPSTLNGALKPGDDGNANSKKSASGLSMSATGAEHLNQTQTTNTSSGSRSASTTSGGGGLGFIRVGPAAGSRLGGDGAPEQVSSASDAGNMSQFGQTSISSFGQSSGGGPSDPEARIEENEAKAAAQKKSRMVSLTLLGTATFIAIIAGVITGVIVYLASVSSLEQTAVEKGEAILDGASVGINNLQDRLVMNVEQQAHFARTFQEPTTNHTQMTNLVNETLYKNWASRIHVDNEIYAFALRFYYPPIPDDEFIPQVKEEQLGCPDICARPGDPEYTSVANWAIWYDILAGGGHDFVWAEPEESGIFSNAYRMIPRPPHDQLAFDKLLYRYNILSFSAKNGTFTDGFWLPPRLWTSSDNSSYYFFTYQKMFRHLNVSFNSVAFSTPHGWFNVLKQLVHTSDKEFLLLTDGVEDRVLGFSDDELGDRRLWNCTSQFEDGEAGVGFTTCVDLSAHNHPHWFVRSLYADHKSFVLTSSAKGHSQWAKLGDGSRYLVISKEIFFKDMFRVIATYAMHEDLALQDLESRTIPTVVISAMIVVMASVFLAAVGYIMIRRTHKTVEIVAEVAFHISRYDIENGEEVLARSAAAQDGNDALRAEFANILENLKAYRAFLPAALQHPDPLLMEVLDEAATSVVDMNGSPQTVLSEDNPLELGSRHNNNFVEGTESISAMADDLPPPVSLTNENLAKAGSVRNDRRKSAVAAPGGFVFAQHRLKTTRLRSVRGTVMFIDIGHINIKHTAPATLAVNSFFSICIDAAKEHGGVVDNLSANGVLISFNYHVPCVKHEELACRCGLAMSERLNKELAQFNMHAAIAISSGFNLVGTCGTEQQKSRVVIGEAIDMLQKINALQRRLNCEIVVSEQVAAGTSYATAAIDVVSPNWLIKQRTKVITLFELRRVLKNDDQSAPVINKAVQLMRAKAPDDAVEILTVAVTNFPHDKQVKRLLEVCRLQRERILKGYSRAEIHWESMESAAHLDDFLTHSASQADRTDVTPCVSMSESNDMEKAKKELKQQQRAKEVKMEMKSEEEGQSLFSIFVSEPAEAKEDSIAENAFEIPKVFVDVRDETWTRTEEMLGRGQFGEVYTCISETGTLCALKAFPISSSIDVDTLVKETEILQKMRHEHVAGYVSCAVLEHHFMIMMEYLAAGTLRKMIANVSQIPTRATYRYLQDVLHGLVFLHENDLAHCDLKPDNCLFAGDGTCKLADFGTAKLLTNESVSSMVRGTPRYMAPEAALGDWRMPADIYSIGIILIEMVTGKNPWSHVKGDDNTFLMRLSNDATMAPEIPSDMDPKLKSIAEDCLQRDPTQRPTAEELLAKLLMG